MHNTVRPVAFTLTLALGLGAGRASAAGASAPGSPELARARQARWALVTNTSPGQVAVYGVERETGALSLHSTAATETAPGSIAVHPTGRFAYVACGGTRSVQAFKFNTATGALSAVGSFPVPGAGSNPHTVAIEPLGRFLYVTSVGSNTIAGFWINPLTGALTLLPGFPLGTGTAPHEIVFDRFGFHAFVGNWRAGTISAYDIRWTGRLTPVQGSPFATDARPEGLAMHPSGRFLYAAHSDGGGVSAFAVSPRGVLTPVTGSPFAAGLDPFGVAASVDGRTLYISEPLFEVVLMRRADTATGALSDLPPSRVPAGNNVRTIRVDPSGRFLYVRAIAPSAVFAYSIDADGLLTPVVGSPFMVEPGVGGLALVR